MTTATTPATNTRYGYAKFNVISYRATEAGLPPRKTLSYFEWNAPEATGIDQGVSSTLSSGYEMHQVTAYACKLYKRVTGRNRDQAIAA